MAKRRLFYLCDTAIYGLWYQKQADKDSLCFLDSSFAGGENRKSTYGYVLSLGSNVLSHRTKQQQSVATSTTEAEFTSVPHAVRELLYLKNLGSEVDITSDKPTVYVDNQSTIPPARRSPRPHTHMCL